MIQTVPTEIQQFQEIIRSAAANKTSLRIRGGGSKDFFALRLDGDILDTRGYSGIVEYEPTELVFTARAGTPLGDVEAALADRGQMLPFEPPHFGASATFGGCIAAGFSGPRRVAMGSVRDFVLGVRMLNSAGEDLRFGGQVMKNVAGYDVSRLMAGSFGTLGLMLEISIKVLPRPEVEQTLRFSMDEQTAIKTVNSWAGQPLPLSASCYVDSKLYLRLSGAAPAVSAAQKQLGGEPIDSEPFWYSVREQTHPFFAGARNIWRISLKSTAPALSLGPTLIEWHGSQRWISGTGELKQIHTAAAKYGGHAGLFRHVGEVGGILQLPRANALLQNKIKHALDPHVVFGPRRLVHEF